jgi:hypothetical protein
MKPFDLQAAINGAPMQYEDGEKLKFIAYVPEAMSNDRFVYMNADGYVRSTAVSTIHIFMAPVVKTYWVNVYAIKSRLPCFGIPFDNEAEAIQDADYTVGYIKTISFIIEE